MSTAERTPFPLLRTPFSESGAEFSPDGRWLAYESNESGQMEVYVRPFVAPGDADAREGRWPVSTAGGLWPVWAPDGSELYCVTLEGDLMAVLITATDGEACRTFAAGC